MIKRERSPKGSQLLTKLSQDAVESIHSLLLVLDEGLPFRSALRHAVVETALLISQLLLSELRLQLDDLRDGLTGDLTNSSFLRLDLFLGTTEVTSKTGNGCTHHISQRIERFHDGFLSQRLIQFQKQIQQTQPQHQK